MSLRKSRSRIYLGGAGGAPTNNVIRSIRESGDEYLVGASCIASDLLLADTDEKYWVPPASDKNYEKYLLSLLDYSKVSFAHFQNDFEIKAVSGLRDRIKEIGVHLFMPEHDVILNCIDKSRSYEIWQRAGITVPKTMSINNPDDLKNSFDRLGDKIWLRANEGGGGRGALPTDSYEFAKNWIDSFKGWGSFTAAECLTPDSITWLSIWYRGELVVAQTRRRLGWGFANRTLSGITGVTAIGETVNDSLTTDISMASIHAIDKKPHGIYGVDLTYDSDGIPNPTEINISRFFTTVYFFTMAGLNMPRIMLDIALENKFPVLDQKINPLPEGLLWIRGMDQKPVLINREDYDKHEESIVLKSFL